MKTKDPENFMRFGWIDIYDDRRKYLGMFGMLDTFATDSWLRKQPIGFVFRSVEWKLVDGVQKLHRKDRYRMTEKGPKLIGSKHSK